ncbi:MAG: elongation factor Ts [Proteobacteria bacterium]|nr:elongation factor Ts [Pseudomonadota bacterium]
MAAITTALIKELRERTGVGMMDCKKVLTETDGDIEAAIENLRKAGAAAAAKKAGRIAAEGAIAQAQSADGSAVVLVEVNSETDFVAKDDGFKAFATSVAQAAVDGNPADVAALNALNVGETTVEEARLALITKIGENIGVRRFERLDADGGTLGAYLHGVKIGVIVKLEGGDAELAKDVAMHIAASNPTCISADDMPAELLEKEKDIFIAQARESGKPDNIIEKMIEGRMKKFLKENTLLGQAFVKNPDQSVEQLLSDGGASIVGYSRLEVGEGIEKKEDDFVAEVMAQAGQS